MYVKPTLSMYGPFYLASGGYGLYAETTWPGSFDTRPSWTTPISSPSRPTRPGCPW